MLHNKYSQIKSTKPISFADIIVILLAIIFSLGYIIYTFNFTKPANNVIITVYNGNTFNYNLHQNQTITQDNLNLLSGQITIIIKDKKVWVQYSSCKNQICVNTKTIANKGETIICIPLGVRIKIDGGLNLVTG